MKHGLNGILRRVREAVGLDMSRSAHFDVLAQHICDRTRQTLGVNTLKRMFGFKTEQVAPRRSTLDVIAQYLGYVDYDSLEKVMGDDSDSSAFVAVDCLDVVSLEAGAMVRVAYEPARVFMLRYVGDSRFVVEAVEGSRNIRVGDVLTIAQLAVGHRFVASHVDRAGCDLGAYESARFKGIRSVDII